MGERIRKAAMPTTVLALSGTVGALFFGWSWRDKKDDFIVSCPPKSEAVVTSLDIYNMRDPVTTVSCLKRAGKILVRPLSVTEQKPEQNLGSKLTNDYSVTLYPRVDAFLSDPEPTYEIARSKTEKNVVDIVAGLDGEGSIIVREAGIPNKIDP